VLRRIAIACLAAAACAAPAREERHGFVARLGRDTVSLENITRRGDTVTSDEVDRFPRVRRRRTTLVIAADGSVRRLDMSIYTPSEPSNQQHRRVVAELTGDSVRIMKRDSTGTRYIAFATGGALTMPHLPQMYGLTELYFKAALEKAGAPDSVVLRQYYIDREFDRFPLHRGVVRRRGSGKAELHHDWLSGYGDATFDAQNNLLSYSGTRSTYKVDVQRLEQPPEIETVAARFAADERAQGGAKQLSVRDTVRATIGPAVLTIDYGRPLARGRVLLGNVLPFDRVWRTGANAATQFTTSAPITLGGIRMEPGTYTLWTVPRQDGRAELIVNTQHGQWGTEYQEKFDLGMKPMATEGLSSPVEKFTISMAPATARSGALVMEWGNFRWSAPIVLQ
jgi:hypothetical protein